MAVNFFDARCQSTTSEPVFGIFDAPPAVLDFRDADIWILWVDNSEEIEVTFTAIDQCLDIPDNEGERCEGMMVYAGVLTFIELKDRNAGRWAGKSRNQLINTINIFKKESGISRYNRLYGHIANRQRPNFKAGNKTFYQEFEDETGFILRVSDVLKIEPSII
ncbi:MAG: hypothetical protein IPM47_07415 [Sphingobacteriales bacterium]|nr:MAG: hypothetical protein IPM47_07415 [Sphingobacteriales bacterium]